MYLGYKLKRINMDEDFLNASKNGDLNFIKLNHSKATNDIIRKTFGKSCLNGHLDIINFLYENYCRVINNDIPFFIEYHFCEIIKNGHLNIIEWIYSVQKNIKKKLLKKKIFYIFFLLAKKEKKK